MGRENGGTSAKMTFSMIQPLLVISYDGVIVLAVTLMCFGSTVFKDCSDRTEGAARLNWVSCISCHNGQSGQLF